jgi:hypothetical protein
MKMMYIAFLSMILSYPLVCTLSSKQHNSGNLQQHQFQPRGEILTNVAAAASS